MVWNGGDVGGDGHGAKQWVNMGVPVRIQGGAWEMAGTVLPSQGFMCFLNNCYNLNMTDFKVLPDEKIISEASNTDILDSKGEKVKFGSLFEQQKTIVVFIRMFPSIQIPLFHRITCRHYLGHFGCGVRHYH